MKPFRWVMILAGLLPGAVWAQPSVPPPRPATQAEVNAGTLTRSFVSPATLAGSGLFPTSGITLTVWTQAYNANIVTADVENAQKAGLATNSIYATNLVNPSIVFASSAGILQNANPTTGAGDDDTVAIQAALDLATNGVQLELIFDRGISLISTNGTQPRQATALVVHPNTTIRFLEGTGLYMRSNTWIGLISNQRNTNYASTNITICGPGKIYANAEGQPGYFSIGRAAQNTTNDYIETIWFAGARNITIRDLKIYNPTVSAIQLQNVQNVTVGNITIGHIVPAVTQPMAAFTFWNDVADVFISDIVLDRITDDAFAFNCDEVLAWSGLPNNGEYTTNASKMTNIVIQGVVAKRINNLGKFAAWGSATNTIERLIFRDVTGELVLYGLQDNGSTGDVRVKSMSWDNFDLDGIGSSFKGYLTQNGSLSIDDFRLSNSRFKYHIVNNEAGGAFNLSVCSNAMVVNSGIVWLGASTTLDHFFVCGDNPDATFTFANVRQQGGDELFNSPDGFQQGKFYVANVWSSGGSTTALTTSYTNVTGWINQGITTNVVGTSVRGQYPVKINGQTYYIELRQ